MWETCCQLLALEALETLFLWQQLGGALFMGSLPWTLSPLHPLARPGSLPRPGVGQPG